MEEKMTFTPDFRHFAAVMQNKRPKRLPLYEHLISTLVMEQILDHPFAELAKGDKADVLEFARQYRRFFQEMTYDVISFEVCITEILPDNGALRGGRPGPIQSRADFQSYPWDELPDKFWQLADSQFDALISALPAGMKFVGGIGNGVFEISEDLVGLEYLPLMQVDDPQLYSDLFKKIGDLMADIWIEFLKKYKDAFVACRFGDDLGFRSSLLTNPSTFRKHILPEYRRVVNAIHSAGKPFLWHSCGCVFEVMEDVIGIGINAKHSNEDAIAPFSRWIAEYGDRIGLVGGFDMNFMYQKKPEEIFAEIRRTGREYRNRAKGYALGTGNSIPDTFPIENYLAMIRAGQAIRKDEGNE